MGSRRTSFVVTETIRAVFTFALGTTAEKPSAASADLTDPMALTSVIAAAVSSDDAPSWQRTNGRPDLQAANTRGGPERVKASLLTTVRGAGDRVEATLAPASWNVIQPEAAA